MTDKTSAKDTIGLLVMIFRRGAFSRQRCTNISEIMLAIMYHLELLNQSLSLLIPRTYGALEGQGITVSPIEHQCGQVCSFFYLTRSPSQTISTINVNRDLVPCFVLRWLDIEQRQCACDHDPNWCSGEVLSWANPADWSICCLYSCHHLRLHSPSAKSECSLNVIVVQGSVISEEPFRLEWLWIRIFHRIV